MLEKSFKNQETNVRKETVYCFVEYFMKFEDLMTPMMAELPVKYAYNIAS